MGLGKYNATSAVHYFGTGPKAFISVVQHFGKGPGKAIHVHSFTSSLNKRLCMCTASLPH